MGAFRASLRTHEIADFAAELRSLHTALRGTAELRTMEQQLTLSFSGDGRGTFRSSLRHATRPASATSSALS
jgi:hypothetical protein